MAAAFESSEGVVPPDGYEVRLPEGTRAGSTMGRIYRVQPKDQQPRAQPRLDKLDTAGLVAALDSPNGWQRDLAESRARSHADGGCWTRYNAQDRSLIRRPCRIREGALGSGV